jgi:hypothetical protein
MADNQTKTLIQQNPKLYRLHRIQIALVMLGLASKLVIYYSIIGNTRIGFAIILLVIVSALSVVVLIGLLKYKTWAYWVLIVFAVQALGGHDALTTIFNLLVSIPIPAYILYSLSKAKKAAVPPMGTPGSVV